jgi:hypothetical protein
MSVTITIRVMDKNSNDFSGTTISANTREEFNRLVTEYENSVTFTKFYTELTSDEPLTKEQEEITQDFEIN